MLLFSEIVLLTIGIVYVVSDCVEPPIIPNTQHDWTGSTPILSGTTVRYECDSATYKPKLGADPTYVCSGDAWTSGNFECTQVTCGYIEPPIYGKVANKVTYIAGSQMKFECNEGYIMSGISSLTCRTDGQWHPRTAPSCHIVTCPEFPDIPHGYTRLVQSINGIRTEYGSKVKVSCNSGYIVNGISDVQCQANGQWTASPVCVSITCDPYPGINSSSCIDSVAWEPDYLLLYLICKTEHTTVAGPVDGVFCSSLGWDDVSMACYCDCHVDANTSLVKLHNADSSGYIRHGDQLTWSCKDGGTKVTTGSIGCNDGRIAVPECQPRTTTAGTTQKPTTKTEPLTTTTEPCGLCVQVKSQTTEIQGKTYEQITCSANTATLDSYAINWDKGGETISTYISSLNKVVLLDTMSGYKSNFSFTDQTLTVSIVFPLTKNFNGKYTCVLQSEDEAILSSDSYQFTKNLPKESLDVILVVSLIVGTAIVAIVIAIAHKGPAFIKYMSEKFSKSGDNPGNDNAKGAGVTATSGGRSAAAVEEGKSMLPT